MARGVAPLVWAAQPVVALDVESSGTDLAYGLQPWRVAQHKAWLTSIATAEHTGASIVFAGGLRPNATQLRALLMDVVRRGAVVVGWNIQFDVQWLLAYGLGDLVEQLRWLDGSLLWRHATIEPEYDMAMGKRKSYGLKAAVAARWPQHATYAEDVDYHGSDPVELEKLHAYNKRDSLFTLRLTKYWWHQLTPEQQQAAWIEAQCIPLVAAANLEGMVVDAVAAQELSQHLTNIANTAAALLIDHGVTEAVVRSPTQLATVLFDRWGLPVLKETTSGNRSTDKEVLHELSFRDERVAQLRLYRGALANRTKFVATPQVSAAYNGDDRTHPAAVIFGTYSGRFTYYSKQGKGAHALPTGFALHQSKRATEFRRLIHPPRGYTLLEVDASGQEYRWMAIASGDTTMLSLCEPGEDPHSFMGAAVAEADYRTVQHEAKHGVQAAKDIRQFGKVSNLSFQYRTGAKRHCVVARVQYNMDMTPDESRRTRNTYLNVYVGVPQYWAQQIAITRRRGWVETLAGRRVQVVGNWDGAQAWSMESTAINYRIQGTGADQKYLALAVLRPYLHRIGARFAWDLHDGLYFYVPDAQVNAAAETIPAMLLDLPYREAWGFTPPITMPWDCKIGPSWGDLQEYR